MEGYVNLREPDNLTKEADLFFAKYTALGIYPCDRVKGFKLKPKTKRVCRYCGKKYGEVSFQNEAHRIPQNLGNRHLLSDCECDDCNTLFSTFESDLATYFLPLLTMQGIKGKKGKKRSFTSPKVVIKPFVFEGIEMMLVTRTDTDDSSIVVNRDTGKNSINFVNGRYVPLNVYKSFLKMALSCLSDEDALKYKVAIHYLFSNKTIGNESAFAKIVFHQIPMYYQDRPPVAFLYKKSDPLDTTPNHIFVIRFANVYVQFFIPFNIDDIKLLYTGISIEYPICPPVFHDRVSFLNPEFLHIDLSHSEETATEEHSITFTNDPELVKKEGVVLNPDTGIEGPLDTFGSTKTLVLTPPGLALDKDAVKRLTGQITSLTQHP